jgi:NADPH:quinone reductase-like Zn-dependent oxidoreductase
MSSVPTGHHLAAILPSQGASLGVTHRPTPTPGPDEIFIDVKAIALNPVDYFQRDIGFMIAAYPAIIGSDVAGTIISVGSSVTGSDFKPGTRVLAFATSFYAKGSPDYGGFQKRLIVPAANATPLPESLTFNEGAMLPMAVETAWAGWYTIGVARDTKYTAADKKGLLLWGGTSSVGSAALQIAKLMGFIVYVTASEKHHEYLKTLGAHKTFDYKDEDVVAQIVKAAKEDGVTIQTSYVAVPGATHQSLEVLEQLRGEGITKVAHAARIPEDFQKVDWADVKFVSPPQDDEVRTEHFQFTFNVWLKEKLAKGEFVPSPKIQVVPGGLEALNDALDILKKGVSGVKIVLEV